MIKGKGEDERGDPVLLFGLSSENLRRLRQGQPIRIDLAKLGMKGEALIFYGSTEEAMLVRLRDAGMLADDLITHPLGDGHLDN